MTKVEKHEPMTLIRIIDEHDAEYVMAWQYMAAKEAEYVYGAVKASPTPRNEREARNLLKAQYRKALDRRFGAPNDNDRDG